MSRDPVLLARYLRQIAELGGPDLFLEGTADAMKRVPRPSAEAPARPARTQPAPAKRAVSVLSEPSPARTEVVTTLEQLAQQAAGCTLCRLHASRTRSVFGEGHANADVAVVGEAPGQEEDRTGRPFVGRAGRMLDLLLMSAGFPREQVYICNVLKCRPPNNRNPLPDEMDLCTSHYLHAQLDAVAPRVLLAVGRFAVQALLGTDQSIGRLRGRVHDYRGTPAIVSYHPAYLLRSPGMARAAWDDLQLLRTVLDEQA